MGRYFHIEEMELRNVGGIGIYGGFFCAHANEILEAASAASFFSISAICLVKEGGAKDRGATTTAAILRVELMVLRLVPWHFGWSSLIQTMQAQYSEGAPVRRPFRTLRPRLALPRTHPAR